MSKRRTHRVTVAKRNLFGARLWWMTCTCTDKQGYADKQDALEYATKHEEKVKA